MGLKKKVSEELIIALSQLSDADYAKVSVELQNIYGRLLAGRAGIGQVSTKIVSVKEQAAEMDEQMNQQMGKMTVQLRLFLVQQRTQQALLNRLQDSISI